MHVDSDEKEKQVNYIEYATQFRLGSDETPIYIIRAGARTRDAWNVTDGHAKNFLGKDGTWHFQSGSEEVCTFHSLNEAFAAAGSVIDISHSTIQQSEETYQQELEEWKKQNQPFKVGQEMNIMAYDATKDVQIAQKEIVVGEGQFIVVSIHSYNQGEKKLQLIREHEAESERRKNKLGRMTKEEVLQVSKALSELAEQM